MILQTVSACTVSGCEVKRDEDFGKPNFGLPGLPGKGHSTVVNVQRPAATASRPFFLKVHGKRFKQGSVDRSPAGSV
jgi:hypothetical protein